MTSFDALGITSTEIADYSVILGGVNEGDSTGTGIDADPASCTLLLINYYVIQIGID
jgi:hypothetical protein